MVLLSALNKLKDFVVWSWTYLWAIWFLLVSTKMLNDNYYKFSYNYMIEYTYNYIFLCDSFCSGCVCSVLFARTIENK